MEFQPSLPDLGQIAIVLGLSVFLDPNFDVLNSQPDQNLEGHPLYSKRPGRQQDPGEDFVDPLDHRLELDSQLIW